MNARLVYCFVCCVVFLSGCKDNPSTPAPAPTVPVVKLISPLSGDNTGDSILVNVEATDDKGVVKVEFFVDNSIIKTWVVPPFTAYWGTGNDTDNTRHQIFAKAYDADGNITTTPVMSAIIRRLDSVRNISLASLTPASLQLKWQFKNTIATRLFVERSVNGGDFAEIAALNVNTMDYTDTNLDTGRTYQYRIKATKDTYIRYSGIVRTKYFSFAPAILLGHTGTISSIAYSPNGQSIASGSVDKTIKIWDAAAGSLIKTISGEITQFYCVTYSPDGQSIASGCGDGTVRIWNVSTGELLRTLPGTTYSIYSITYSPDGQHLASSTDATIKIWNAKTGALIRTLYRLGNQSITSIAYSPDGKAIVSGSIDNNIHIWNAITGDWVKVLTGHTGYVKSVTYSPDGQNIASGSYDGTIKIWNVATGLLIRTLSDNTNDSFYSIGFSPDGLYIASGGWNKNVKIWNTSTGALTRSLSGHSSPVFCIAYSPNGQNIASGSSDNTIKIWSLVPRWIMY